MKKSKHLPKPGQKVTVYTADGKICRGELTVKEVIGNEVYFVEPLTWVQVGDQMWFHVGNKLTFCDGTSKSPTVAEPRGKK